MLYFCSKHQRHFRGSLLCIVLVRRARFFSFVYCLGLCRRCHRRHHLYHSRCYFVIIAVIFAIVVAFCFYCFQLAFARVHISNEFALVEIIPAQQTNVSVIERVGHGWPETTFSFYCLSISFVLTYTRRYTNMLSRFVHEYSLRYVSFDIIKLKVIIHLRESSVPIESLLLYRDVFFCVIGRL